MTCSRCHAEVGNAGYCPACGAATGSDLRSVGNVGVALGARSGISEPDPNPSWVFQPVTAWAYLALQLLLAFTPLFPAILGLSIASAIFVYRDREWMRLPSSAWTVGTVLVGALVFLAYVYKRRDPRPTLFEPPSATYLLPDHSVRAVSSQPTRTAVSAPADWYADPYGTTRLRYWDGTKWTDHTSA